MSEASDTMEILHQNLIDAGCSKDLIETCMELAKANKWKRLLPLLAKQRINLLDSVHDGQKQIDCLDFLVYSINKKHIQEDLCNGSKIELDSGTESCTGMG